MWCGAHGSRSSEKMEMCLRNGTSRSRFFWTLSPMVALNIRRLTMSSVTSGDVAMTVALRGLPVSSDCSPHHEPAPSVRISVRRSFDSISTSQVPSLIR